MEYSGFQKSSVREAVGTWFQSPNWVGNLLWLSLAGLTSSFFVGLIGLFGYGSELIEKRAGRPDKPTPDIDANRLGDYFTKGIWPFLVYLTVQLVVGFCVVLPVGVLFVLSMFASGEMDSEVFTGFALAAGGLVSTLISLLVYVVASPFIVRSMVCQDFAKSFDWEWAMDFLAKMKFELLWSALKYSVLSLIIGLIGTLLFCIGSIPAQGIILGGMVHLSAQWYEIYLNRGGIPIEPPPQSTVHSESVDLDVVDAEILDD